MNRFLGSNSTAAEVDRRTDISFSCATRRNFLKSLGSAAGVPLFLGGCATLVRESLEDKGEVTVIDTEANKVIGKIPVGFSPTFITIPPRSRFGYVTNYGFGLFDRPKNTVTVIDIEAMKVTNKISVGDGPMCIHLGRGDRSTAAYVANFGNPFTKSGNTVSVVDTRKQAVVKTIRVGRGPVGTMPSPDGKYIFVPNYGSILKPDNTVSVIETSRNTVAATIKVGVGPSDVKFTPDGKFAWVVNYGHINDPVRPLSLIDLASLRVVGNPVAKPDSGGKAVGISPDGSLVYACHFGNPFGKPGKQISVFDTRRSIKEAVAAIPVNPGPSVVKFHPRAPRAYVGHFGTFAHPGDTISVIDIRKGAVIGSINGVRSPTSIAFAKGGNLAFVTNFNCCPG